MIKYVSSQVTFSELPTEISLSLSISNCQNRCRGCHSAFLREDIGTELSDEELENLIHKNNGITAVLLLGEGKDKERLITIAETIRKRYNLKAGLYSGREKVEEDIWDAFDYVKVGAYIEHLGALESITTNQRLYAGNGREKKDITNIFWKKKL